MSDFILAYLDFFKVLTEKNGVKSWKEDYLTVNFVVVDEFSNIKTIFSRFPLFEEELKKGKINFKFELQGQGTFYNSEFFQYKKFLKNEEVNLTIRFNKKNCFKLQDNDILFFNSNSFREKWNLEDNETLDFFNKYDKSKYINIYLPISKDEQIHNNYLNIISTEKYTEDQVIEDIAQDNFIKLETIRNNREELTKVPNFFPIPELFWVETKASEIKNCFDKNIYFSGLYHIANKYTDGIFLIRGRKNIELNWLKAFNPDNVKVIFKIYTFIYKIEKFVQDKLEITRNILSIYNHGQNNIESLDKDLPIIYQTIQQHFNIYISNEVKDFFDNKKDAIDEAQKYAMSAREAADKIITNINASIIAIVTVILSAVITLSRGNILFLILALILHMIYLLVAYRYNSKFAREKKTDLLSIYKKSSEQVPLVSKEERDKIQTEFLKPALDQIDNNITKYKTLTIRLIIGMCIILLSVALFYKELSPPKDTKPERNIYIIHAIQIDEKRQYVNHLNPIV